MQTVYVQAQYTREKIQQLVEYYQKLLSQIERSSGEQKYILTKKAETISANLRRLIA